MGAPSGAGPMPEGFGLRFSPRVRRPSPRVLIGGTPLRVLRLSDAGAALVDGWMAGRPVGGGRGGGALAARLVDAGLAAPCPTGGGTGTALGPETAVAAAIVVPVRDDAAGLEATLDALASTARGVPVVVVDDGSEPAVDPGARPGVSFIRRPAAEGPAAARNAGLAFVRGSGGPGDKRPDVAVFVDAGCIPPEGWLQKLLPHFEDPALAAVAPRVVSRAVPGTPPGLAAWEEAHSPLDLGPEGGPVRPGGAIPYVPSAVLAVRLTALHQLGGFDPGLRYGEDVDLVWRLGAAGWRVRYAPAVGISHPGRPNYRAWLLQRFHYGRSAAPLALRHGRAVAPLALSPWSAAAWGLLATGHPLAAVGLGAGSGEVLARRAGSEPALAGELRRVAAVGNLRAGGALATAIRRAWLPPAALAAAAAWPLVGRRTRRWVLGTAAAVAIGPGLGDWRRRGGAAGPSGAGGAGGVAGLAAWVATGLADDLAYQAGVWTGAVQARSGAALLPRW